MFTTIVRRNNVNVKKNAQGNKFMYHICINLGLYQRSKWNVSIVKGIVKNQSFIILDIKQKMEYKEQKLVLEKWTKLKIWPIKCRSYRCP